MSFHGLRPSDSPGSHHSMPEEVLGYTGADGRIDLEHPTWTHEHGETIRVSTRVSHHLFPAVDVDLEPGDEVRRVVMLRGVLLSVSGWIGDPTERVLDVVPHTHWQMQLKRDDWLLRPGQSPSTHKASAGPYGVWLSHRAEDGSSWWSDAATGTLSRGNPEHLHLQLVRAGWIEGVLDAEVPRPVADGEVVVRMIRGVGQRALGSIQRSARVAPDGTFRVTDLPAGFGELVARCRGWRTSETTGVRDERGERTDLPADAPAWAAGSGNVVFSTAEQRPVAVPMVRGATAEVVVRGPGDVPVVGARVDFWPNVYWSVGSTEFPGESAAETGSDGVATVEGLPAGPNEFRVTADAAGGRLELPVRVEANGRKDRSHEVELSAGRTTRVTVHLERTDGP